MIRKYSFKEDSADFTGQSARVLRDGWEQRKCPSTNFVETHKLQGVGENESGNIPLNFVIGAGVENVLFEDFTENHNKTYFQISNLPTTGEPVGFNMLLRVTTDDNDTENPQEIIIPYSQTRAFQVENLRRVTVQLLDLPVFFQRRVSFYLEKTFCISCSEGGKGNVM